MGSCISPVCSVRYSGTSSPCSWLRAEITTVLCAAVHNIATMENVPNRSQRINVTFLFCFWSLICNRFFMKGYISLLFGGFGPKNW